VDSKLGAGVRALRIQRKFIQAESRLCNFTMVLGGTLILSARGTGQTHHLLAMFTIRIPVFVDTFVQYTFDPLPVS
jgi:hypothetical protein